MESGLMAASGETMDSIAQAYVELAHDIERLDPGYIDGYFGGSQWKGSGRTIDEMADAATDLMRTVSTIEERDRRDFLTAQVCAMLTRIGLLRGEPINYSAEVRGLYDVEAVHVPEKVFEDSLEALNDLLPGTGSIEAREQAFRKQFEVDADKIPMLLDVIIPELRRRTLEFVDLPESEGFELRMVSNEPWSAYNWYLGAYQSRVELNSDLPASTYLTALPELLAHEAYPGHHTEHLLKEQKLWHEQGRSEHTLLLINAPECVISEGIATRARRMIMSDEELVDWLTNDLAPLAGLHGLPIQEMMAINRYRKNVRSVGNNAAMLYHSEGASKADVIAYLQKYRLATEQEARKSFSFMTHPNFRSYGFTYTAGGELLDALFAKKDAPREWFKRLLVEPITPGVIREWISA